MPLLSAPSFATKPRLVAPHQAVLETMPHPVARNDASRSPRLRRSFHRSPLAPLPYQTPPALSLPTRFSLASSPRLASTRTVPIPSSAALTEPELERRQSNQRTETERSADTRTLRSRTSKRREKQSRACVAASQPPPCTHKSELVPFFVYRWWWHSSTGWRAACCAPGLLSMRRPRASLLIADSPSSPDHWRGFCGWVHDSPRFDTPRESALRLPLRAI